MNLYMRTLGFASMDSKLEKKFIRAGIKQCVSEGCIYS